MGGWATSLRVACLRSTFMARPRATSAAATSRLSSSWTAFSRSCTSCTLLQGKLRDAATDGKEQEVLGWIWPLPQAQVLRSQRARLSILAVQPMRFCKRQVEVSCAPVGSRGCLQGFRDLVHDVRIGRVEVLLQAVLLVEMLQALLCTTVDCY